MELSLPPCKFSPYSWSVATTGTGPSLHMTALLSEHPQHPSLIFSSMGQTCPVPPRHRPVGAALIPQEYCDQAEDSVYGSRPGSVNHGHSPVYLPLTAVTARS